MLKRVAAKVRAHALVAKIKAHPVVDKIKAHPIAARIRVHRIRNQLSDIRQGLRYYRGDASEFPFGWALVPMRRAGINDNDNAFDWPGKGPKILVRDVMVLEPHYAMEYRLDDAEALEKCTRAYEWFHWAADQELLSIPDRQFKSELKRMSAIALRAFETGLDSMTFDPPTRKELRVMENLQRYANRELG